MSIRLNMLEKIKNSQGFIAALDQSGGSSPKALEQYGISSSEISSDEEMFKYIHSMRARIISSSPFNSQKILGAILFKDTLNRYIENIPTAEYLWKHKEIVPFLKIDEGLMPESDGVQLMKPIKNLGSILTVDTNFVFGTKMRSVIKQASRIGIQNVVKQQFEIAKEVINSGLMPIIEPEVDIYCEEKQSAELMLHDVIIEELNNLEDGQQVILKLTLPEVPNLYKDLATHPKVLKLVALSGGYSITQANEKLKRNTGIIASFSRALLIGLHHDMSDKKFDEKLNNSIEAIYEASICKL